MAESVTGSTWKLSPEEGGTLAGRWWKWALSAPDDASPVKDTTGEHAGWKQPEDVWFLAGTYGGKVTRHCEIPADRPVFFPVLNVQVPGGRSAEGLRLPVARAESFLNGAPLPLEEFHGQFRSLLLRRSTWGLWGALAPLRAGAYVLEIKADTGHGFWVDTTYHLTSIDG
ncbi:hypothetical protein ACWD4J_22455 [Streptomyces sp. NPDC002577]